MYLYRAYGLIIRSDVPLPELVPAVRSDRQGHRVLDVRIGRHRRPSPRRDGFIGELELPNGGAWRRSWHAEGGGLIVTFADLSRFALGASGEAVVCTHRSPGVAIRTVRHLVLDQLMPLVLAQRGREILHSTAIATAAGVVAFTGPAGSGKSTTAAAFCRAGFIAVADDCLSLIDNDRIMAVPAYPGLRLWDDSAAALKTSDRVGATVAHYTPKRRSFPVENYREFPFAPLALARVYRVERDKTSATEPRIEAIAPRAALLELVQMSFQLDPSDQASLQRHFRFMERVVQQIPIRRLIIPEGFELLPRVREAVLRDLSQ